MFRSLLATFILPASLFAASSAFAQAAPSAGETMFKQRCGTCHSVEAGQNKIGPSLKGVVGRKAGAVAGFSYSNGMKSSGLTWTAANIDEFLKRPAAKVPGTKMMLSLADATQRQTVISYLASKK
jgi:cytochrome c